MRSRIGRVALAALMLGVSAGLSSAQDALVVNSTYVSASRDPGQRIGPAPPELQRPLAGGGRFAVGSADVVDLRTGQSIALPPGAFVLAVDPARPRAFLKINCDVDLDVCDAITWNFVTGTVVPLGTTSYSSGGFFSFAPAARYAVDADVLFLDQASARHPIRPLAILPINASTGAPLRSALAAGRAGWDVLPDASRLFVGTGPFASSAITAIDVASGDVVATSTDGVEELRWHPALNALTGVDSSHATLSAYGLDLALLAWVRVGAGCSRGIQVSAHTGRITIEYGGGDTYIGPIDNRMLVFAPETGSWSDVDLGQKGGFRPGECLSAKLLTAPGPPQALRASVAGRAVTLHWGNLGEASGFVLDVGFAPGRTDAQIYLGPDSHVSFAEVPPGTYYLRLRGGNEFGGGRASNEVRLVVP